MNQKWASTHRKALLCLLLSSAISIVWGTWIAAKSDFGLGGFKAVYYGTRCLLQHRDPYSPAILQRVYQEEGGRYPSDPARAQLFRQAMLVCVNLPTSLFLLAPLAILPWKAASVVWIVLNATSFLLSARLIWSIAREYALRPSTLLICLLLANIEIVLELGNLAGMVVTLCVIAIWCFFQERFVLVGVVCLAISLLFKPHDTALIWFYFFLAGGILRRRALQVLGLVLPLALAGIFWVSHIAPNWPRELHANLLDLAQQGRVNDPGPQALTYRFADYVISLQSVFSLICDQPRFYNSASYLICGLLLLAGAIRVYRTPLTQRNAWIALAALAPLSMLPVYHRTYDAKLLLLTIPACAMLWREGGRPKWMAGILTTLAILSISDFPAVLLAISTEHLVSDGTVWSKLLIPLIFHPAPLVLLATGAFYTWVYFRWTAAENRLHMDRQDTGARTKRAT